MKIEFFKHNIGDEDIERVNNVLRSIFLTTGDVVLEFEKEFSDYLDIKKTVGVTSCTAALHLSLLAWGVGPLDEVITTPMSFCATTNAILHSGATPVFVDVEEETGNINAELIPTKITDRTKAIIPVHLYGQMCDMKKIKKIADKYKLIIIEDAAHCIEGIREGIKVGELGDAACFSFYATKNITSGEGGAIGTNNTKKSELLKILRLHGIDKSAIDRYTKRFRQYDMPVLGWKYNMDNIQAALLIEQMKRIDTLWEKRGRIWRKYEKSFDGIKDIEIIKTVPDSRHARHLFTIHVPEKKRDRMIYHLQKKGIGVAVNYMPIHLLKYYRKRFGFKKGDFPVAENIGARTITLPIYPRLKDNEVNYVIDSVLKGLRE